jgi:tetratricopeptide (TPR) repeat protein
MEGLTARFSTWLLRPYLDLGPFVAGPLHVVSIEEGWRSFVSPSDATFIPQRAMPPGFRIQLAEEAGKPYALSDPRELAEEFRTSRWRDLCDAMDGWEALPDDRKCRLASLLHSLCLYRALLTLIPDAGFDARHADPVTTELAFWRASANFMHQQQKRSSNYVAADMAVFEDIALNGQDAVPACFNATAKVFVHKAKTGADLPDLAVWGKRFEDALAHAIAGMDEFAAELHTSRFYRGMGFLPQRAGDRKEVVRMMDLAERHALKMMPATSAQQLLYRENMHALMESRTKEALWLGEMDLALARTLKVIDVDPYDSKAWAEVGEVHYLREEWQQAAEAYAVAAMLGPPASAVGRHLAGVCLRKLDQGGLAALLFKSALDFDPLGISPRQEILNLPDIPVLKALKEWSRSTTEQ